MKATCFFFSMKVFLNFIIVCMTFRGMVEFDSSCWYGISERWDIKRTLASGYEELPLQKTKHLRKKKYSEMSIISSLGGIENSFIGKKIFHKE